ncbi:hypothetical protein HYALB_00003313 [Hymenoscyphus albidus]|uniref:Uncharacterized protein n=1 Tax=Hymenoscyphus albidus TaxID=595503 RepID=A0A9N9LB52_9HELO|nr:hypothetical protein HYALB_00003313 [Hymenoscyphus albidus]
MMGGVDQFHLHDSPFSDKAVSVTPISFSCIEEAKYIFEYGVGLFRSHCAAQGSDHSMPASGIDGRMADFSILLSNFSHALEDFKKSKGPSITPKEQTAMDILRLHVLSAKVALNFELLPPDKRSTECTGFLPEVREILDLGEKIIDSNSASYILGGTATSFCLDMGYIIPIYTVASHWQDATIRRRAIAILRSLPRQEGIWNSILVAKAAERIMELEGNASGGFKAFMECPNQTSTQPFLEIDARGGRLQYTQGEKGSEKEIKVVEKIFTW